MKRFLSAASAAAILLAAGTVLAQNYPAPAPGGAPAAPGAPGPLADPAIGAPIQGEGAPDVNVTVETIVAALENSQTEIGELGGLPETATIQLVDLNEYLAGPDAARIEPLLAQGEAQADELHQAIGGNQLLTAELESADVQLTDVVGIDVTGTVVLVFTRAQPDGAGAGAPAGDAPAAPAPAAP